MNEHEQIKKDHPFSYRGIFYAYDWKEIKESRPFWISVGFSAISVVSTAFSTKSYYDLLVFWVNQIMTVFPNLLGFNLGGYALIVGFGNTELVERMTSKGSGKKASVFQKLSSIFAFAIILQLVAFIAAFVVNICIRFELQSSDQIFVNVVNGVGLCLLSFLAGWGLFIIPNLVVNVFNFGQMHHFHLTMKKRANEQKPKSQASEK